MNQAIDRDEQILLDELAAHGVIVRGFSDVAWDAPHPAAIPILLRALDDRIDPVLKMLVLGILGRPWAEREAFPRLLDMFQKTDFSRSLSPESLFDRRQAAFDDSLVAAISRAPAKELWPQILEYARRPDLGYRASLFLRRAGKLKNHSDEVLALYEDLVGSDSAAIEISIAEGLRLLGDPRGVAILMRVKDLNSTIMREKAKTLDKLQGRD